jgi:hypothetical protein
MANPTPALKYRVTEAIYDSKSMLDETNFYHQRQGHPSELTRKLTYIMGDYTKNYPISLMTLGGIGYEGNAMKRAAVELDDPQFTYPVMGRITKASIVSSTPYSGGDKPGVGNSQFKIRFTDNWIKRFFIIQSARGVQAYVHEDPVLLGTGEYEYTVSLDPALPSDFCPLSELQPGAAWIDITTAVAESGSRTTESKMAMPGQYKNQMSFLRHGFSWAGNSANKVMKISVKTDKGETDVWMDWAMWQYEMEWLSVCEHNYWYSRYNRQANGTVALKDLLTGKVIPRGSGILEQIQNKGTYSDLSYDYLVNNIGDALFGQSDTAGISITLHTGRGGMRAFDRAIRKAGGTVLANLGGAGNVADKFITGTGYHLALGGYFDQFYHIDGYTIKVKHNPIFDMGKVAMAQQAGGYVHPETGWPLESYRMVFIDDNDYDGQPNIQHVAQKGRAFQHGVIAGLTNMPKSLQVMTSSFNIDNESKATLLATDKDESAYTRFKSAGIQILRANRCFDFQCIAGL